MHSSRNCFERPLQPCSLSYMSMHPRYEVTQAASREIGRAISQSVRAHKLTYGEITSILASELASFAKFQIRDERHPGDPDARGDEE